MSGRRGSRSFMLGSVAVGGGAPVSVQSMATVPLRDGAALIAQIERLHSVGCEIVRIAVDSVGEAELLKQIAAAVPVPLVADIQFCPEAAAASILNGAAGIRINPGLFRSDSELRRLAELAVERAVPIRVGANSGSIGNADVHRRIAAGLAPDEAMAEALVEGALAQCRKLEDLGVRNIKVALKSSSVPVTVAACRRLAAISDYPLHLGVTETGAPGRGIIKSACGIGALLLDGIGDTLRVSLTAPPEEEVIAAIRILEACGLRDASPEVVACPTCGRTEIDLPALVDRVEKLIAQLKAQGTKIALRKVAVMGCPVNGPGEAREADLGLAGSRNGELIVFAHGQTIGAFDFETGWERFRALLLEAAK